MPQTISYTVSDLPAILTKVGATRVLLVASSSFRHLPIRPQIEAALGSYVLFDHFTPNPKYEEVCEGVQLFNHQHCDTIVAVGGGSNIDVAKCIKLYCHLDPSQNYLQQEYADTGIPLIAIPTTAGTGSESTRFAVIYCQGNKQSVHHLSIIPDYAILESSVLLTLPEYQKKCTLLDALCQAVESWWSVNSTQESKDLARQAVQMIVSNCRPYIQGTGDASLDSTLAESIMKASNLAGQAINITQTTAPHAFSYKLTSLYRIPHGHAVAVSLPFIWRYMIAHPEKCIDGRGSDYLMATFSDIAESLEANSLAEAPDRFLQLLSDLNMDFPVSSQREADLLLLSNSVNPVRLKNNPVALDIPTIYSLYAQILR